MFWTQAEGAQSMVMDRQVRGFMSLLQAEQSPPFFKKYSGLPCIEHDALEHDAFL
jgi:hypothetical protein